MVVSALLKEAIREHIASVVIITHIQTYGGGIMKKQRMLLWTLIATLALGSSVGTSSAFDLPGPMKNMTTGLTEEAKKVAIKKVEEAAEEAKKKLREEAHAQLETQIKKIDEELKKQVEKIMSS